MRGAASVFAATVKWTAPVPVPVAPAVMVTHSGAPVADHAHEPAEAVTVTEPDPPAAATDWLDADNEKVQGPGAAWVTLTVSPATVRVPVRCELVRFAAAT
jgi:hypothetical protein